MVKDIYLIIEGDNKRSEPQFRKAFRHFFRDLYEAAEQKGIKFHSPIMAGSNREALKDFTRQWKSSKDAFVVLLVDADAVVTQPRWQHLKQHRKWDDVPAVDEKHCHLMVTAMETWLIADLETLASYYKQGFNPKLIPKNTNVEQVSNKKVLQALNAATKETSKGKYHKTRHAPDILYLLNPEKVRQAAPHCKLLFETLRQVITG